MSEGRLGLGQSGTTGPRTKQSGEEVEDQRLVFEWRGEEYEGCDGRLPRVKADIGQDPIISWGRGPTMCERGSAQPGLFQDSFR